jgi:formate/nitrite transporter
MDNNFFTPAQIVENNIKSGVNKANLKLSKMILLGIFAGMFIAIGAEGSNLSVHNISDVGLARTLAGTVFPVGLMLLVIIGGELFTGNCMLTMALADKQIRVSQMLRNWIVVFFSNMAGAVFMALLVCASGQFDYSDGGLGAYTIKVAMGKTGLEFSKALISGILCNFLVCVAVLMAASAKDIIGKIFAAFFPIMVFVISGFEHCVANMYYIPAGMMAATNDKYVEKACELYGYTADQISSQLTIGNFFGVNLLPVTIGNIIGGGIIIGLGLYVINKKNDNTK